MYPLFVARRFLFLIYLNCFPQCLIYNWTQMQLNTHTDSSAIHGAIAIFLNKG